MSLLGGINWLDVIVLFVVAISLVVGFAQGLLRQVIGLAALYVATILGAQYFNTLSNFIRTLLSQSTSRFLNAISFFIIVVAVWLLVTWLAFDVYRSAKIRVFPLLDPLAGSILSLATAVTSMALILPVLIFAVGEPWPGNETFRLAIETGLRSSRLVPLFEALKPVILSGLAPWLPLGIPSIFNL